MDAKKIYIGMFLNKLIKTFNNSSNIRKIAAGFKTFK